MSTDVLNILIVVDVQNCFMTHMFGGAQGGTFLNVESKDVSSDIAKEISNLANDNDLVVFTRDYHPINHISFEKDEGRKMITPTTWPHHCRNINKTCTPRPDKDGKTANASSFARPMKIFKTLNELPEGTIELPDSIPGNTEIKGTHLSYFFYSTPIAQIVYDLNVDGDHNGRHKLSKESNMLEPALYQNKYITLTKGEECDKESYSAFNYHISYKVDDPSKPVIDDNFNPIDKKNSTGLWEWILSNLGGKKNIKITVCGLVGNVCVMHTVLQGKALWDEIYKNEHPSVNVEFILSLKGTRFTTAVPPGEIKPDIINDINHRTQYQDFMNLVKPKNVLSNDAFTYFTLKDYNGTDYNDIFTQKTIGGNKKNTLKRRNAKTKRSHAKKCKCRICIFGGNRKSRRGKHTKRI